MLDIRDNLRDDERRQREEARLNSLQEQIDELRLLLREGNSRHGKVEEAQAALGEQVEGVGARIEGIRTEARSQNELRLVEMTRIRDEIEEVDQHFSKAITPFSTLQAQLTDLGSYVRTRFQELGEDRHRFDELQAQIERFPPLVERSADVARGVREELVGVRAEIDEVRADWRKTGDAVGIVEQELRRRSGDLGTRLDETNGRIDLLKDELPPLHVQIDRSRAELQAALPKFDQMTTSNNELRQEIDRVAAISFDHHTKAIAKADESRVANEERLRLVERLNDTRFTSTLARFGELEEADRSIGHRITLLAVRLDELRDEDSATRLEVRRLEELRLRVRIEQAQQEVQVFTQYLAQLQEEIPDEDDE